MTGKRPPLKEELALYYGLIAVEGTTTAPGAALGNSIIDAKLIGAGANSYVGMSIILYPGNIEMVDSITIEAFNNVTGEVTLEASYKGAAVALPTGVPYKILTAKAESAGTAALIQTVLDILNATLVTTETGGTVTPTGPGMEDIIYINDAPAGVFEPIAVQIDFTNQTAAEMVVVRVYYRILAGGNLILKDEVAFAGLQHPELKNVGLEPNRFGLEVTMELTAGAAQDYDWAVIKRD